MIELWWRRQQRSLAETMRYLRDAARGGLFAFIMLGVIIGSLAYHSALQRAAPDFPYWWIAVIALTPVLAASPIRTYLHQADIAFLLAAEPRLAPYFRRSYLYSLLIQGVVTLAVTGALWPMYSHFRAEAAGPFWVLGLLTLAAKALQLLAGWETNRLVFEAHRQTVILFRWVWTALFIYAAFRNGAMYALAVAAGGIAILAIAFRLLPRYRVAWQTLIRLEEQMRGRRYTVFNWFADVPQLHGLTRKRPFWSKLAAMTAFRRRGAYLYLYSFTFVRSELLAMVLRLTLAGWFIMAVLRSPAAALITAVVLFAVTCVQLSGLAQYHRLSVWPRLYPLPAGEQLLGQAAVMRTVLIVQSILNGGVVLLLGFAGPALLVLVAGLIVAILYPSFWTKRKAKRHL